MGVPALTWWLKVAASGGKEKIDGATAEVTVISPKTGSILGMKWPKHGPRGSRK